MESDRCEITPGVGVQTANQPIPTAPSAYETCQNVSARGHRCRTPSADDSGLCAYHARRRAQPPPDGRTHVSISDDTAEELLGNIDDFNTPAAVNLFLGNLVEQVVRRRVTRRDAIALAYLSQLLLNSLSAMSRERILKEEAQPRVNIIMDGIMSPDFGPPRDRRTPGTNATKSQDAGQENGQA
jgi:hypothetical protein